MDYIMGYIECKPMDRKFRYRSFAARSGGSPAHSGMYDEPLVPRVFGAHEAAQRASLTQAPLCAYDLMGYC